MAYGVMSFNGGLGNIEMLPGIVNKYERFATGATAVQVDNLFFSDFIHSATTSATVPCSGGVFYTPTNTGGTITTNSTTDYAAFGVDNAVGVLRLTTGTTNNNTAYAAVQTAVGILSGIPTPTTGFVTKYEWECTLETDSTVFGAARNGSIRFGMMSGTSATAPADGVYFEFLYDGSTNDTTWNVVFRKDNAQERVNTTMTFAASKTYRLYMSVEKNTGGTYTTTYKVKNVTDNTETNGTAAPSVAATYYPAASGDYMGIVLNCAKAGTATANSTFILVDYVMARIRRKLFREMVILGT
jgi:hypothetical protein